MNGEWVTLSVKQPWGGGWLLWAALSLFHRKSHIVLLILALDNSSSQRSTQHGPFWSSTHTILPSGRDIQKCCCWVHKVCLSICRKSPIKIRSYCSSDSNLHYSREHQSSSSLRSPLHHGSKEINGFQNGSSSFSCFLSLLFRPVFSSFHFFIVHPLSAVKCITWVSIDFCQYSKGVECSKGKPIALLFFLLHCVA